MRPIRKPKKLNADELWEYALRVLDTRAYSGGEMRRKLAGRAQSPSAVAETMAKLGQYGLLDDKRFAESYATARLETQGFGAGRVLRDLRARSIRSDVAINAVEQVYAQTDENALIQRYLERKFRGKDLSTYLKEEKHLLSAYRRLRTAGFRSSASIRVLKQFAAKASELEGMEEGTSPEPADTLED